MGRLDHHGHVLPDPPIAVNAAKGAEIPSDAASRTLSTAPKRSKARSAGSDTNPIFPRPNLVPDLYVPHLYGPWVASFRL